MTTRARYLIAIPWALATVAAFTLSATSLLAQSAAPYTVVESGKTFGRLQDADRKSVV